MWENDKRQIKRLIDFNLEFVKIVRREVVEKLLKWWVRTLFSKEASWLSRVALRQARACSRVPRGTLHEGHGFAPLTVDVRVIRPYSTSAAVLLIRALLFARQPQRTSVLQLVFKSCSQDYWSTRLVFDRHTVHGIYCNGKTCGSYQLYPSRVQHKIVGCAPQTNNLKEMTFSILFW